MFFALSHGVYVSGSDTVLLFSYIKTSVSIKFNRLKSSDWLL